MVSESTVYIGNAGNVILSDIYKFEKDMCNGSVKLGDASQTECAQLKDLALMIERIIKRFKKVEYCEDTTKHLTASGDMSSYYLKNFIGMCLLEKIKSVDEALQKIIGLKDSYFYRKPQQSLIKAVVSPSKRTRKDKEANK